MRGQAHTIEGVIAGLLLVSGLVFALEVTAVTPLSASTSSQHVENQQAATATGLVAWADAEGALADAVLDWNASEGRFNGAGRYGYYADGHPDNDFGRAVERRFTDHGIAVNVYLVYATPGGERERRRLIYRGEPSNQAVTASRTVVLYDHDRLRDAGGGPTGTTVGDTESFYARDVGEGDLYNVVRVEVVAWRM